MSFSPPCSHRILQDPTGALKLIQGEVIAEKRDAIEDVSRVPAANIYTRDWRLLFQTNMPLSIEADDVRATDKSWIRLRYVISSADDEAGSKVTERVTIRISS